MRSRRARISSGSPRLLRDHFLNEINVSPASRNSVAPVAGRNGGSRQRGRFASRKSFSLDKRGAGRGGDAEGTPLWLAKNARKLINEPSFPLKPRRRREETRKEGTQEEELSSTVRGMLEYIIRRRELESFRELRESSRDRSIHRWISRRGGARKTAGRTPFFNFNFQIFNAYGFSTARQLLRM